MLEVKIKAERENFKMPIKGSKEAACYDVYVSKIVFKDDGMVICHLGFSTEIPPGWKGVLIPRSSLTKYGWVIPNSPGVIDSDYRNEWQARFRPLYTMYVNTDISTDYFPMFPYNKGERVAQIYFERVVGVDFIEVEETSETERGMGGFGHTGVK